MGGLRRKLPITFWTMMVASLAMVGVFPFAGFWAKDEILAADFHQFYPVWLVGIVTAFLTAIFMFRLMFLTFWGESRADAHKQAHVHESPPFMTVPLVLLAVPSALLGLVVGWPPEGGWIHRFLEPVFFELEHVEFSWIGTGGLLMLISLAVVLAGIGVAHRLYLEQSDLAERLAKRLPSAYRASYGRMYMDEVFEAFPIRATVSFAQWLWTAVDVRIIDGTVNGMARLWEGFGERLRPLQTGRVESYALSIFVGMLVLVVVFTWVWVV